jgi:hypothetical protein
MIPSGGWFSNIEPGLRTIEISQEACENDVRANHDKDFRERSLVSSELNYSGNAKYFSQFGKDIHRLPS